MKIVTEYLSNVNICYVILNILLLVAIHLYLKEKKMKPLKRRNILLDSFIVSIFLFNYFSGVFDSIFNLKYLSVKGFLLLIVATIGIILFTINKNVKLIYSSLNYTLVILMATITFAIVTIVIGDKYPEMYVMDIRNVVVLIDLSFVIFIIYSIITLTIYIGYYVFNSRKQLESSKSVPYNKEVRILTDKELLNYEDKNNFYINEVECSIIFEDSNQDNIIKNYHILSNNVNDKMVNGFTLKENQLLRSICNKLQIYDLNKIDINNINILNKVTIEEYNFLKKIIN